MTHQRMLHAAFDQALRGLGWEDLQVKYPSLTKETCWDLVKAAQQRNGSSSRRGSGAVTLAWRKPEAINACAFSNEKGQHP